MSLESPGHRRCHTGIEAALSIVIAGWVSAILVFSSFFMKTMIPLRMVAICSNISFISYALLGLEFGVFGRVYPILSSTRRCCH